MELRVLSTIAMLIASEDDVVLVRRKVRALAQSRGFDAFASAAITTATSEITRNVWVHARRGEVTIDEVSDGARFGIRLCFRDEGPGIEHMDRVLAGGYSTARSLGLGVSGTRRLVDDFTIASEVGKGTTVHLVKWTRF